MKTNDYVIANGRIGKVSAIHENKALIQYEDARSISFFRWICFSRIKNISKRNQSLLQTFDKKILQIKEKKYKLLDKLDPSMRK